MEASGSKCRMKGKKSAARGVWKPPPLPEGAWANWGKHALYFTSPFKGGRYEEVWLGVYVINTSDDSIYHVVDFTCSTDPNLVDASEEASCVVLESRVCVASSEYVWFHEIGGGGPAWNKGPKFNGKDMFIARLFSFRGCLYGINLNPLQGCFYETKHNFQILCNEEEDKGWLTLDDPPTLCTTQVECESLYCCDLLAVSCIGLTKVILHVCTKFHVVYLEDKNFIKHHFLCYETDKNSSVGKWTNMNIDCMDSFYSKQNPCPPPCRSHLLGCEDDLLLLFPTSYGKLGAFVLSDSPELRLKPLDVDFDLHALDDPLVHSSILIQISPGRYYAVTFSQPRETAITRPIEEPADYWGTLETALDPGYRVSWSPEPGVDFSVTTFDLYAHRRIRFRHRFQCRYSGLQLPLPLLSGKAYAYP